MLRKMLPLLVVGIFVLSGLGAVSLPSKDNFELEKTTVSFSQPVAVEEDEFISLDIAEANSFIMKQGKPLIPSYTQEFIFPFGTKIKSVTATPKNIQTKTLTKELMPTPQAVIVGQAASKEISTEKYGTDPYPASWFTYDVGCGLIGGELSIIVDTETSAVKYNPADQTIEWANSVDIAIEYETTPVQSSGQENYDLLIITADEFEGQLTALKTHKDGRGIPTKITKLSQISGPGRDIQEKIKYYIKDAIETWGTTNVMIVGAWKSTSSQYQKFPARETHIETTDPPDDELFVSDLYYADIYNGDMEFCDWDADGDDIFGEMLDTDNIDEVDLHPDVYLGRIPAISGTQVATVVDKIKTYENNEAYLEDWFTNLVVLGGDTSPGYDTMEGEYVNQKVIDMMDGFSPTKLWVTNGKLTSIIPSGDTNIKNAINSGCGFVDFSGHGNTNVWATHKKDEETSWVPTPYPPGTFHSNEIATLSNGNKLPIVTVEACSTAKFYKDENTFNWAYLHNSGGGGIGAFGATALGWGYVGTGITQGLIGKMGLDTFRAYRYDGATTFGEMWGWALERYIGSGMDGLDFKTTEEWEPFGDPTLQIAEESQAPNRPTKPSGPTTGDVGTSYTYSSSATDPDGDKVYLKFDWGDGTDSGWKGPFNSGSSGSASHSWTEQGNFEIKVAAKDVHGKVSDFSTALEVSMPRSREINSPLLKFLQNHPNLFPVLQVLLQRLGLY